MTTEQSLILQALADFVNERKTVYEGEINIESLFEIGKKQQISGILYYQLQTNESVRSSLLLRSYVFALKYYHNRIAMLNKIDAAFNEHKISYMIVKGSEVAALYPVPALRTMGDSDILVHHEDMERANCAFEELGIECTKKSVQDWQYKYEEMSIELHPSLLYNGLCNHEPLVVFANNYWKFASAKTDSYHCYLDWSFHFIFLILHLRKHFINSGVGFRQFMDLAIVAKNAELDWHWIKKELKKLELLGFAEVCMTLCEKWFGVSSPLNVELDEKFVEDATERIFANGVFGFIEENKNNRQILDINKTGRLKITLSNFFPSYSHMRTVEKYKFIDNKPYLLPAAWAYRAVTAIGEKKVNESVKAAVHPLSISNKELNERNRVLEEWKLK